MSNSKQEKANVAMIAKQKRDANRRRLKCVERIVAELEKVPDWEQASIWQAVGTLMNFR